MDGHGLSIFLFFVPFPGLYSLIGNEQAGFRCNNATNDHVFVLHCLVDLHLQQKKKLYCLSIDYKNAFDLVQIEVYCGTNWFKWVKIEKFH